MITGRLSVPQQMDTHTHMHMASTNWTQGGLPITIIKACGRETVWKDMIYIYYIKVGECSKSNEYYFKKKPADLC